MLEEDREKDHNSSWVLEVFKKAFREEYLDATKSIMKPTWRYYIRANTLRTNSNEILSILKADGIIANFDERIEEALYIEGYVEQSPSLLSSYVIAKLDAAESCAEGADLYRPGALSLSNAEKNSRISIITQDFSVAAEGELVMDLVEFKNSKKGLVVKNLKPKFKRPSIHNLKAFKLGLIYPQSYPSLLTVKELDPRRNETIIDMCASPGGKLSHIIQLTKGEAKVIACDKSHKKVEKIKETLSRLQLPLPSLIKCDSRYLDLEIGKEVADKILLDPSCTDLGLRPRITLNIPKKDIQAYAEYQRQLLKAAKNLLKKGGILCYSVCTISLEETVMNFEYAVSELGFEECTLDFLGERRAIHIFKPHKEDTPGYVIFKVRKPS